MTDWRKVHVELKTDTSEIQATGSWIGDANLLADLLDVIADGQRPGMVTADGGYDTPACRAAIAARGATCFIQHAAN